MIYTENPVAADILIDTVWRSRQLAHAREEGVHVSDLIYCLRKAWYRQHGYPEPELPPQVKLKMLLGEGLGTLLENGDGEIKAGLRTPYGVLHGTIDLLQKDGDTIVCELKETRSSSNKSPFDFPHYLEQIASYCVLLETRRARLVSAHLLGDWKGSKEPVMKCWELEFTAAELAAWERELVARMAAVVQPAVLPSPYEHYQWECKDCAFNIVNGGECETGPGRGGFFHSDHMIAQLLELERDPV